MKRVGLVEGNGDLTSTTARNWIMPPTWMNMEEDLELQRRAQPRETLSTEPSHTVLDFPCCMWCIIFADHPLLFGWPLHTGSWNPFTFPVALFGEYLNHFQWALLHPYPLLWQTLGNPSVPILCSSSSSYLPSLPAKQPVSPSPWSLDFSGGNQAAVNWASLTCLKLFG